MPLTREQENALCSTVEAKAAAFAASPAKGHAAGYKPIQTYAVSNELDGSLQRPRPIPLRDDFTAWLYGVASRDLSRFKWQIIECPEGRSEIVIV